MKSVKTSLLAVFIAFSGSVCSAMNPVSVYCFDDANNLAKDCKGADNGSVVGIPPIQVAGWISQGAVFGDDNSSYISIPPSTAQNSKTGFSISFWMKSIGSYMDAFPIRKGFIALSEFCSLSDVSHFDRSLEVGVAVYREDIGGPSISSYSHRLSGGISRILDKCAVSEEFPEISESETKKASAWRHYVWTADIRSGTIRLYIDGRLKHSITGFNREVLAIVNSSNLDIGRTGGVGAAVLDEVRFFNAPMTDSDVLDQWAEVRLAQPIENASLRTHCLFGGFCARTSSKGAHTGIDYMASAGASVYSLCGGTIDRIRLDSEFFNQVIRIHHDSSNCGPIRGKWAYYGHVSPEDGLTVGTKVSKGQKIGTLMDWGGNSHLHLSVSVKQLTAGWGYHNTPTPSDPNCEASSVTFRSGELKMAGFSDISDLAASHRWDPLPLLTTYGRCAYTSDGLYEQTPYGFGIPYWPFYKSW